MVAKLWLILAVSVILIKGIWPGWTNTSGDFNNYYVSAKLISEGFSVHQFYDNSWFYNKAKDLGIKEGAKFSPFPPVTAYTFLPITFFMPLVAQRVWLILNSLLLLVLPFRIHKITNWSITQGLLFLSLFTIPIASCLSLGQLYLVIGYILIELVVLISTTKRSFIFGFSIGLLTSLKYIPILFLGYILKHQKRNSILCFSLLGVLLPSLIVYILDHQSHAIFVEDFLSHIQGNLPGQGKYAIAFQSIDSLLNNLFVFDSLKNTTPFLNLSILKPILKWMLISVIFGMLFIAYKKNKYKLNPTIVSLSIIGVFVVIPASASYHFLLLLWPILCILKWMRSLKSNYAFIFICVLIFATFTVRQDYIPTINKWATLNLIVHYPRFWGLLCLFFMLYYYYIVSFKKNND